MPSRSDEGYVLARYPYRERDLIVAVLTRFAGQIRVLARGARSPRSGVAPTVEPLAHVKLTYFERSRSELATLGETELVRSAFPLASNPPGWAAGQVVVELTLLHCPAGQRLESAFRLVDRCTQALLAGHDPLVVAHYAELWFLRLAGVLPEISRCGVCGAALTERWRVFDAGEGVFVCGAHPAPRRRLRLGWPSVAWLGEALRRPVEEIGAPAPADAFRWMVGVRREFTDREVASWRYLLDLTGPEER